jgi:ABC-type glycerol-3-phosphate transport system substrate-binding protein
MKKQITAALLALALCLSLAACGQSETHDAAATAGEIGEHEDPGSESRPAEAYDTGRLFEGEKLSLPGVSDRIFSLLPCRDGWYFQVGETQIFHADNSFDNISELSTSLPEDFCITAIGEDTDGRLSVAGFDAEEIPYIWQLDLAGEAESSLIPMDTDGSPVHIERILPLSEGWLVFSSPNLLVLDSDGRVSKNICLTAGHAALYRRDDGSILAVTDAKEPGAEITSSRVIIFSPELKETARYDSDFAFQQFAMDRDGKLLGLQSGVVFRWDYENDSREPYIDVNLSQLSFNDFYPYMDGRYISSSGGGLSLWQMSDSELRTLTMAQYDKDNISWMNYQVDDFNSSQDEIRIKTVDYTVYDEGGTAGAGMEKLRTDIISGNTPDLYDLNGLPAELYASKGIFADIKPYLTDEGFKAENLLPPVQRALDMDGHIYFMPTSFAAVALCVPASVLGADGSFSSDDFFRAVDGMEPAGVFGSLLSKEDFIQSLLIANRDIYMNRETLNCNFTDSDFTRWLEFSAGLPDEYEFCISEEAMQHGELMMGIDWYPAKPGCCGFYNTVMDGEARFVGFPTSEGDKISLAPESMAAVSATTPHMEEAMEFIRYIVRGGHQGSTCPVNESLADEYIERQIEKGRENIEKHGGISLAAMGGGRIESSLSPEEDIGLQCGLIDRIDRLELIDDTLLELVLRECRPFWAGQNSAEQTARNIEAKVGIYLSEQYG